MESEQDLEMAVEEFRIALTSDDVNAAIAFYRDGLGLDPGDVGQIMEKARCSLLVVLYWKYSIRPMPHPLMQSKLAKR